MIRNNANFGNCQKLNISFTVVELITASKPKRACASLEYCILNPCLTERHLEFHLYESFIYDTKAATYPVINFFTDSRLLFV